jgi:hypothetical protein
VKVLPAWLTVRKERTAVMPGFPPSGWRMPAELVVFESEIYKEIGNGK